MWAHAAVCIYYCANIKFTFRSRASWGCDFAREAWFHAFLLTTSQLHRCSDPEGSKKIGQGAYPLALCHIFYRHKPFLKAFVHSRYLPRSMETLQTVSNQAKRFVSICVSTHYYFFRSWNSVRSLATPVISCPNIVIWWDFRYHFPLRVVATFVLPSPTLFHQPRDPRLEHCGFHHCQCVRGGYLDSHSLRGRWYGQGPRLRATSQLTSIDML